MKIAIYGRSVNDHHLQYLLEFFTTLNHIGAEIVIYKPFSDILKKNQLIPREVRSFDSHQELENKIDFILSLGGDGTLLDTIALVRNSGIPLLGINTGRLGFLANVSKEEIKAALEALQQGEFTIDQRTLLKLETTQNLFGEVNYALNELTLLKKDSSAMMTIHAYLNGDYLNSYWADGLIISTPTGSTAYSLSCGGPIVMPDAENFIITPIAPHNLNVRPLIIPDNSVITLQVEGRNRNYLVSMDSRSEIIDSSIELTIKKENFKINLIKLQNQNFLNTIRKKLMWGLDSRN